LATTAARLAIPAVLLAALGCEIPGIIAYAVSGEPKQKVAAQYVGLEGRSFAVLVSADADTLFYLPDAPSVISQAVSRQIATDVTGTRPVNPRQIARFQEENPYWMSVPPGRLLERLDVERLIIVDLVQFDLHEPGNSHVWKGLAVAHVSVVERENAATNRIAYTTTTRTEHPPDNPIGVLETDAESFRLALLSGFARDVARLFHDHKVVKKS
jgi:hypothetical protein